MVAAGGRGAGDTAAAAVAVVLGVAGVPIAMPALAPPPPYIIVAAALPSTGPKAGEGGMVGVDMAAGVPIREGM